MTPSQPSNPRLLDGKKGRRRQETMHFAYSGPFHCLLDSRVGRSFIKPARNFIGRIITPEPRYSCSAENYSIGAAVGPDVAKALEDHFGRERASAPRRRKRTNRTKVSA